MYNKPPPPPDITVTDELFPRINYDNWDKRAAKVRKWYAATLFTMFGLSVYFYYTDPEAYVWKDIPTLLREAAEKTGRPYEDISSIFTTPTSLPPPPPKKEEEKK